GEEDVVDDLTDSRGVRDLQAGVGSHSGHDLTSVSVGNKPSIASLSSSASGVNGLMRYSCAPAASARTICVCSLSVVTIMRVMPRVSGRERTAVTKDSPSITGMFQSTRATSGSGPDDR